MDRPSIICLTPVRNEEWILDRFLRCAGLWADLIILADQGSQDETVTIASRFSKVQIIKNERNEYDEFSRQKLLIDAARKSVPGPKLLITLDADEAFTANYSSSKEWKAILNSVAGTVIRFRWVNLLPGCKQAWLSAKTFAWGFMDDGTEHSGTVIHNARVPTPPSAPTIICDEIKVLHYQYTDPKRMESKHRWYQCFERLRDPRVSAIKLFDQYHHMHRVQPESLVPVLPEWLECYERAGIDMTSVTLPPGGIYWWDPLVLQMLQQHGMRKFAHESIWDDWPQLAKALGAAPEFCGDPRTWFEKKVHRFLMSPGNMQNRPGAKFVKSCLKRIGF